MPRVSARQLMLQELQSTIRGRQEAAEARDLLSEIDSDEDEMDDYLAAELERVQATRYAARLIFYRRRPDRWAKLLSDRCFLNDTEFLQHFRLQRGAFFRLVSLVKADPIFTSAGTKPFRGGAELHMMVLLKYLGASGSASTRPAIGLFLGVGSGTVDTYLKRATKAVLKLMESVTTWPDIDERKSIARRMKAKYGFVNCIGMTDGTLLTLAHEPAYQGEDYYSRKGCYSVNALVTCDDLARVRHIVVGWPGSVHDNRVWTNIDLCQQRETYFSHSEYLLGDSAFQPSSIMVPAFKKPPRAELSLSRTLFNKKLAKARIKTEHCIGLLKARFQLLTSMPVLLTSEKSGMRRLIQYVTCASILHNTLIAEPVSNEWADAIQQHGSTTSQDADDELNVPIPREADAGERRIQLISYLLDESV